MLVDADNVVGARLQALLDALPAQDATIVAAGRPEALAGVRWPPGTRLLSRTGWQRADVALARAYQPHEGPLLLVSGDGDFALLAARHPGPVLVVSEAPAAGLRAAAPVLDPVHDGLEALRAWLAAVRR